MNFDIKFPIAAIKSSLNRTEIVINAETDAANCYVEVYLKGEPVIFAFGRQKVLTAYNEALEQNQDFVIINYEMPTDEDIDRLGFKRDGKYLVPK